LESTECDFVLIRNDNIVTKVVVEYEVDLYVGQGCHVNINTFKIGVLNCSLPPLSPRGQTHIRMKKQ